MSRKTTAISLIDAYKADHRRQYPEGTELVYSNFTPRSVKLSNIKSKFYDGKIVFFGIQYFCKHVLLELFNDTFFNADIEDVVYKYQRLMDNALGKGSIPIEHIRSLHALGYLPIEIRALPEGVRVKPGVPVLTIHNTLPEFFWVTNYLETILSCQIWKMCTSATTAAAYRTILEHFAEKTGGCENFIQFQAHDFSFRGMSGYQDAEMSGAGHLLSFVGTDSFPSIDFLEDYYCANSDNELIGCSVPATEHSVMTMHGHESELEAFKRLITKVYPNGIVSIVSDSYDYWAAITEFTVALKDDILARDGKLVFRPDSGDPVLIVTGDDTAPEGSPERKGTVQCLWEIFGGTVNDKGYKTLDSHVGVIYGDSITIERAIAILERLEAQGFASDNIVFGVGSFTYQFVTRDTSGFAVKSTFGIVDGTDREIFKDPKTGDGVKKSARGKIRVFTDSEGDYVLADRQDTIEGGALQVVFQDGKLLFEDHLFMIRNRVQKWNSPEFVASRKIDNI